MQTADCHHVVLPNRAAQSSGSGSNHRPFAWEPHDGAKLKPVFGADIFTSPLFAGMCLQQAFTILSSDDGTCAAAVLDSVGVMAGRGQTQAVAHTAATFGSLIFRWEAGMLHAAADASANTSDRGSQRDLQVHVAVPAAQR